MHPPLAPNEYSPEIRFADIDAMGHVNNAVYLSYFEQARIKFFRDAIGRKWDWQTQGILVARNEIDYKKPVFLNDRIIIRVECTHIGNKSFSLSYHVLRFIQDASEVCTDGKSILVCFDHSTHRSIPVPPQWRMALETYLNAPQ
jgi:acyl-CoA thioester hydrolase